MMDQETRKLIEALPQMEKSVRDYRRQVYEPLAQLLYKRSKVLWEQVVKADLTPAKKLSPKAAELLEALSEIEENVLCNQEKVALARLFSILLEETIEIEDDNEEPPPFFEPGTVIKILNNPNGHAYPKRRPLLIVSVQEDEHTGTALFADTDMLLRSGDILPSRNEFLPPWCARL
jgi:hypothetical protein